MSTIERYYCIIKHLTNSLKIPSTSTSGNMKPIQNSCSMLHPLPTRFGCQHMTSTESPASLLASEIFHQHVMSKLNANKTCRRNTVWLQGDVAHTKTSCPFSVPFFCHQLRAQHHLDKLLVVDAAIPIDV